MDRTNQDQLADPAEESVVRTETAQRPRVSLWKRTAGVVAVAAVLIVGNTSTASAAAPSAVSTLSTGKYIWHVALPPATAAAGADASDEKGPEHGEFPIVDADGTVHIRRWQSGTVVASTPNSVTVLSSDGYQGVYQLGAEVDVQAIADGAAVTVVGTLDPEPVN